MTMMLLRCDDDDDCEDDCYFFTRCGEVHSGFSWLTSGTCIRYLLKLWEARKKCLYLELRLRQTANMSLYLVTKFSLNMYFTLLFITSTPKLEASR